MTTDIERQFFDTFEIKKIKMCTYHHCKCTNRVSTLCPSEYVSRKPCRFVIEEYPQITDRILLGLICVLSKYQKDRGSLLEIDEISLDEIKEEILEMLIYRVDGCKHQIQKLFKECE